jgi:hypothetical protein
MRRPAIAQMRGRQRERERESRVRGRGFAQKQGEPRVFARFYEN